MDYTKFYIAIRRYAKGRITRKEFLVEWSYAQRQQGINPQAQNRTVTA